MNPLQLPPPIPPGSGISVRETINQMLRALGALTRISSPDHEIRLSPTGLSIKNLRPRSKSRDDDDQQILYGKPTATYDESTLVELDPCDVAGNDLDTETEDDFVDVVVKPPLGTFSDSFLSTGGGLTPGTPNCELTTDIICAYTKAENGEFILLGMPKFVMTGFNVDGDTQKFQIKGVFDWGLFHSSESDWMDVHTGTTCPS